MHISPFSLYGEKHSWQSDKVIVWHHRLLWRVMKYKPFRLTLSWLFVQQQVLIRHLEGEKTLKRVIGDEAWGSGIFCCMLVRFCLQMQQHSQAWLCSVLKPPVLRKQHIVLCSIVLKNWQTHTLSSGGHEVWNFLLLFFTTCNIHFLVYKVYHYFRVLEWTQNNRWIVNFAIWCNLALPTKL